MSEQQSPLSYEMVLEMFRETREQMKETDRKMKETDRKLDRMIEASEQRSKRLDKKISALGSRIGEIVESMVRGNIVDKFRVLGYDVTECSRNKFFEYKKLGIRGEIDLFLDDGDVAILIEVKTTLETEDVRNHIERLEKYRRYVDAKGSGDKRHFIGAVAGAVASKEVIHFAYKQGLHVIVQSGDAVEIVPPPEGFTAKEW